MSAITFASGANCPFSFMLVIDCKPRSAGRRKKNRNREKKKVYRKLNIKLVSESSGIT